MKTSLKIQILGVWALSKEKERNLAWRKKPKNGQYFKSWDVHMVD